MRPHVPDDRLTVADVPAADASWERLRTFGHTFHAYKVAGSLQRVADLTVAAHDTWSRDGELPADLTRLRIALFHTVRAAGDVAPDPDTEAWTRALVAAIRDRLGPDPPET